MLKKNFLRTNPSSINRSWELVKGDWVMKRLIMFLVLKLGGTLSNEIEVEDHLTRRLFLGM